jgi:MoaA/NifB/PqqE/SkfB family radical SAM enzyme
MSANYISNKDENPRRFDYIAKILSASMRTALKEYVDGNSRGPKVVDLDPTTACNFSCRDCISADLLNKDALDAERIDSLLAELAEVGVKGVVFIGGGEPLAHRSMPRPIYRAHELGMSIGLTTNGSLIKRNEDAISECVSWTRVSMDAATQRTFNFFRPSKLNNAFQTIIQGMESLAKRKKGALGYSFLVMQANDGGEVKTNANEIYMAAELAKNIGCDYFEYKPMFDMGHSLLPFTTEIRDVVIQQQAMCQELESTSFRVVAPESIRTLLTGSRQQQEKNYGNCATVEMRTTITPSGVYPCAYHRGREDLKLGSIGEMKFGDWWQSQQVRDARSRVDPRKDCKFFCARHRSNELINAIASLHKSGVPLLDHLIENDLTDIFF